MQMKLRFRFGYLKRYGWRKKFAFGFTIGPLLFYKPQHVIYVKKYMNRDAILDVGRKRSSSERWSIAAEGRDMPSSPATIHKRRADSAAGKRRAIDTRNQRRAMVKLGDLMKVTREDIQDFPGETITIILDLQKEGWRAQRSNRNHVMLLAPDGVSRYSASRNASSAKYLAADVRRYKAGEERQDPEVEEEKTAVPASPKFACPMSDCQKFYASQDKLNVHIAVDHSGWLKCPDCDETRADLRRLNIHRTRTHGYVSPRKAQRKQQEANRAATKAQLEKSDSFRDKFQKRQEIEAEAEKSTGREKIMDHMSLENLVPDDSRISLKGVEVTQTVNVPDYVSPDDIYRETQRQLASGGLITTEKIDFIDERDSWTLDLEPIMDMPIGDVARVLHAAGLRLEMRSWKE